jgi:hypothetical protein
MSEPSLSVYSSLPPSSGGASFVRKYTDDRGHFVKIQMHGLVFGYPADILSRYLFKPVPFQREFIAFHRKFRAALQNHTHRHFRHV